MSYAKLNIIGSVTIEMNLNLSKGNSFYKITNIKELLSSLPSRGSSTPKQADHGELPGLRKFGPRYLPFEGEIHALTPTARFTMEQNLRKALTLPRSGSLGGDDGYKTLQITDEAGNTLQAYAVVVAMPEFSLLYEGRETMSRFSFAMVADEDPFFYDQSLSEEEGPEGSYVTGFTLHEGGLKALKEESLPTLMETLSNGLTVTNDGTVGTPPTITVYGPTEDPIITNETTGITMSLDGLSLSTGERVEIDVANYAITKFDVSEVETDVSGFLTAASDWIFLEPGNNVITFSDANPDTPSAVINVSYRAAYV